MLDIYVVCPLCDRHNSVPRGPMEHVEHGLDEFINVNMDFPINCDGCKTLFDYHPVSLLTVKPQTKKVK